MTQAVLFMAIVPLALLLVLLFAFISGYLSDVTRVRIQWAITLTGYPLLVLYFGWQAWERQQLADWRGLGLYLAAALILALQLVLSVRSVSFLRRSGNQNE